MKETWQVLSENKVVGFLGLGHSVGDIIKLQNIEDEYLITCIDVTSGKYVAEPVATYEASNKTMFRVTDITKVHDLIRERNQLLQENQRLQEQINVLSETYRDSRFLYERQTNIITNLESEVKRLRQIADDWKETAGLMTTKAHELEDILHQIYRTGESMGWIYVR